MARGRKATSKREYSLKRPNGSGSITKMSGKRRKPYIVRVTHENVWIPEEMVYRQVQKSLGTFKTREEAEAALANYNLNPYNLDNRSITFKQVYDLWKSKKFAKLSNSTISSYETAFNYCSPIADMPMYQIKTAHLQHAIDTCDKSSATKDNMKIVMNSVFNYCLENDIVAKNYTDFITIERSEATYERMLFSKNDIDYLWSISDTDPARILLILLYTGMRVNELLKNKRENYNPDTNILYVPKSLAKNKFSERAVPIHSKVIPFLDSFYGRNKTDLIVNKNGNKILYNNFCRRDLQKLNERFEVKHRFHDTRHTFISRCHELNLDDLTIKKIVGHAADDVHARIYTHINEENERKEIEKLHY